MPGKVFYRNFRLVYRLNNWLRKRFTPAGLLLLAGLITAGVFGLDTRQTLAFQIFALFLVMLLFALASALTFRGQFSFMRKLPAFSSVGEKFSYRIILHNRHELPQHDLLLIDELETGFPDYEEYRNTVDPDDKYRNIFDRFVGYPRLVSLLQNKRGGLIQPQILESLAGGEQEELKISLMPLRRGYLRFQQLRILRPDPFGLFRAEKKYTREDSLLVLPRRYRLPPVPLPGNRKYQRGGVNMSQSVGDSEEFISLREYRPGDPLRSIHWRSYAKKGEPVVKEYQDEYFVRQGLVLDTFLQDRPRQILEDAISVAASFVTSLPGQDALLDMLLVGNDAYHFTAGRGLGSSGYMLEVLACVGPCTGLPFDALTRLVEKHAAGVSGFICIFIDWDAARQKLVNKLQNIGLPVHVIIIANETDRDEIKKSIAARYTTSLWLLQSGDIQASLNGFMSSQ